MAAKKIHQSTITGQRGIALIEQIVLEMGFLWHPTNIDAGIDGYIEIRDPSTGNVTNLIIQVQSKATTGRFVAENTEGFDWTAEEKDLEYWLQGNAPVILVVSRPDTREAYWVSIKDYFQDSIKRKIRKVHFNKRRDKFDAACGTALINLAAPKDRGIYFSPPPKQERLFTNLLRTIAFAEHIYVAETSFRLPRAVWSELRRLSTNIGSEWILRNKSILSFHDLGEYPWDQICEVGTLEEFGSDEWASSDDPDRKREFVQLLNQSLREKTGILRLRYSKKRECYYFAPTEKLRPLTIEYQGHSKKATREVFGPRYQKGDPLKVAYYRHSAFKGQFKQYEGSWYLEITPTYHFTKDGHEEDRFYEARLKRIKQIEGHSAVAGQIQMWAHCLSQPSDMFRREYPFLELGDLLTFEVEFGIDDKAWEHSVEVTEVQRSLFDDDED